MRKQFLLNSKKGINSIDVHNKIPLEIKGNQKLLTTIPISEDIDQHKLYCEEKDKSTKYRLNVTINPIMTNALFNNATEIVKKEGSAYADFLDDKEKKDFSNNEYTKSKMAVNRRNAIRNTEYSNDVHEISYHCGIDIFNNHILRSREFTPILDRNEYSLKKYGTVLKYDSSGKIVSKTYDDVFNTIMDYNRSENSREIEANKILSNYLYSKETIPLHLYYIDNTDTLDECISKNLKEQNGWFGFYNRGTIKKPISVKKGEINVNKVINSHTECEFIDLYPDRTLFSFSPKMNNYRKRLEYNWKYFISYPFENIYEGYNVLDLKEKGLPICEIEEGKFFEEYIGPNGLPLLRFLSLVKHNLKTDEQVSFNSNNRNKIICKVASVGNSEGKYKGHYFSVKKSDFEIADLDNFSFKHFSKYENGYESIYYFRKFKKFYNPNGKQPSAILNSLSFSNNIYGDEISQIQFYDDIDIYGKKDNLGRPLSEIYITFIKNNKGHNRWYCDIPSVTGEDIEYSHAFGKVSSGFDIPFFINGKQYPSIRRQHNIEKSDVFQIDESSYKIEDDITDSIEEFIGDLVEFRIDSYEETVLEKISYRFNTAQREYNDKNSTYSTIFEDFVYSDDFDSNGLRILEIENFKGYSNLNPEGYIYHPNYKIKLKDSSEVTRQNSDTYLYSSIINRDASEWKTIFEIKMNTSNIIYDDDIIILSDKTNFSSKYFGKVIENKRNLYIKVEFDGNVEITDENCVFFLKNKIIPEYAFPINDGSGRYIWRDLLNNSDIANSEELKGRPFTNGAIYVNSNILFPLKRQNPFSDEKISIKINGEDYTPPYIPSSNKNDNTHDEYETLENDSTCW